MAGDRVTDLLDHKLSLTDVDSRAASSYLPVFRATGGSRAIIQFHGGYHFLHIPEKTHFAIMICARRAHVRKRKAFREGDLSTAIFDASRISGRFSVS